jgi:NTE family protein
MIAGGISGSDLVREWLEPPYAREPRFLSRRIVEEQVRRVFASYDPQVEYGLVATHIPSMRPKLFRAPELTWKHLACSTAIPLLFRHHRLEGRLYTDGGLMLPLPLWAAFEMGATQLIGVNLLPVRPAYIQAFAGAAQRITRFAPAVPEGAAVTVISPSRRLGGLRDSIHWSPSTVAAYVEAGREDARRALPLIRKDGNGHQVET